MSIELWDHQIEHYAKIKAIIQTSSFYIDTSPPGTGKTYVSMKLAQEHNFRVFVICPKSVKDVWIQLGKDYNIPIIDAIGYESLRSTKGHQPRHPYLIRDDSEKVPKFYATPLLQKLISEGILVIFDEISQIKNDSHQHKACQAISNLVLGSKYSRFGYLSGTPITEVEKQSIIMLRSLGLIRSHNLFTHSRQTGNIQLIGAYELEMFCKAFDPKLTAAATRDFGPIHKNNIHNYCYVLFRDVVMPLKSHSMPPAKCEAKQDLKNGFYKLTGPHLETLHRGLTELVEGIDFDPVNRTINATEIPLGIIGKTLPTIEHAKAPIFTRLAKEVLDSNPKAKVTIFVNYTRTIKELEMLLADYHPMIFVGATKQEDRVSIVKKFNTDPSARLLIANIQAGGMGISLHDKDGNYPRYAFISPGYKIDSMIQATGRFHRTGTKSDSTIRFIYVKDNETENHILDALMRKTEGLKEILPVQVAYGIKFPGEYDQYIEE